MLTVDFDQFPVAPGERVLDLGCGAGRHSFEAYRRGARVVAVDHDADELVGVERMFRAMDLETPPDPRSSARAVRADLLALPFADDSADVVIAAEVLEHIPDDVDAMAEITRVLRPGGRVAVTVPRWWPERVCWALSTSYHDVPGGHVRIYREDVLRGRLGAAGLATRHGHHAHALHAPYWWLNCAFGQQSLPSRAWHQVLVWDIMRHPWPTRWAERLLNPVLGKSVVVYATKPPVRDRVSEATSAA